MTLHEAIEHVLIQENAPMKPLDIAEAINKSKLFQRKDGQPVPSNQILIRIRNYAHLFHYQDGLVYVNRNTRRNLSVLEDYLFSIVDSTKSTGKVSQCYFVIIFFLFLKRIASTPHGYTFAVPKSFAFFKQGFESELKFTDALSAVFQTEAIVDFQTLNNQFKELSEEFSSHLSELSENAIIVIIEKVFSVDVGEKAISREEFSYFFDNVVRRFVTVQYGTRENTSSLNVNKFLVGFLSNVNGKVIDPFAGIGGTLVETAKAHEHALPVGFEINKTIWSLGYMNLFLSSKEYFEYRLQNCLHTGGLFQDKYDYLVTDMPFGGRFDKKEIKGLDFLNIAQTTESSSIYLQYVLSILSAKGQASILLPMSFLFSTSPGIRRVRDYILKRDWVEAIVSLPTGILQPYSGASAAILVINKRKSVERERKVLMINTEKTALKRNEILPDEFFEWVFESYRNFSDSDESGEVSVVSLNEIDINESDLSPRRYTAHLNLVPQTGSLFQDEQPAILGELLERIGGRSHTEVGRMQSLFLPNKNLKSSPVDYIIKSVDLVQNATVTANMYQLSQSALLIQTYSKDLKPSYFNYEGETINLNNQIAAFSIKEEKVKVDFLIGQLHEDYFLKQINSIRKGTAQSFFSIRDFLQLKIKLPSLEEQERYVEVLVSEHAIKTEKEVMHLEDQLAKSKDAAISEQLMIISSIQHDLGNKLPALMNSFSDVRDFLKEYSLKHQGFSLSTKIRDVIIGEDESTVDDLNAVLKRMDSILSYTITMVDDAGGIISADPSKYKPKKQKIIQYIKDEVTVHYSDKRNIVFEFPENIDALINLDTKQFSKALCNIIDNAIRHGFTQIDRVYHIAFELIRGEEDVVFIIKNDGLPFPEDFDFEEYKQPYKYFGKTGNSGLGGYIINRVIENHNATINLIREIEIADPYKVKIEIKFPKLFS